MKNQQDKRTEILNLIDEELRLIEAREKRPGWSIWALLAGLASIIWVLGTQVEEPENNWKAINHMVVTILFIYLSFQSIRSIFNMSKSSRVNEGRTISLKERLQGSKIILTVLIIELFYLIWWSLPRLPELFGYGNITSKILLWILLIMILLALIFSNNQLIVYQRVRGSREIATNRATKKSLPIYTILSVLTIYTAVVLALPFVNSSEIEIRDLKIVTLITACFVIFHILLKSISKSPVVDELVEIRRDLVLDKLPLEQIQKQVDLALRGKDSTNYFSSDIEQYISVLNLFEKEIYTAEECLEAILSENLLASNFEELTMQALLDRQINHLQSASKLYFSQLNHVGKRLDRKHTIFSKFVGQNDSKSLLEEIAGRTALGANKFDSIVKRTFDIIKDKSNVQDSKKYIADLIESAPDLRYDDETGESTAESSTNPIKSI